MTARRFGGKYSPDAAEAPAAAKARPAAPARAPSRPQPGARAFLMFLLPTPILFAAFFALTGGAALRMVGLLAAYGCLMLGAWLNREGLRAEAAYHAREIARPPRIPRKLLAAGLAGVGVALTSLLGQPAEGILEFGGNAVSAVVFGVLATAAHVAAFGIDPLRAKGTSTGHIDAAELDRVAEAIDQAEAKLTTIEALARHMRDREIDERVRRLNATVREMIGLVERDPRDLGRARRYLGVYLKGAEEATRKFAENRDHLDGTELRAEYLALLSDLEASFSRGKETLLLDDRTDLEVEIEVLRERLQQEGA